MWNSDDRLIDPLYLARKVLSDVRAKNLDPDKSGIWTQAVIESLNSSAQEIDLERKLNETQLQRLHTVTSEGKHQFLLDYIWWFQDPKSDKQSCALAVESEWGYPTAVEEDFEKLLAIKSPIKVMIFASHQHRVPNEKFRKQIIEKITECLKCYGRHEKGEIYVLVDFRESAKSDRIDLFHVPNDYSVNDVELASVENAAE